MVYQERKEQGGNVQVKERMEVSVVVEGAS